jgi:hypothetical protein
LQLFLLTISFCPLYSPFGISTRKKYVRVVKCSDTSCDKPLDAAYWEAQYKAKTTGWDLGQVSPNTRIYDKVAG